VKFDSQRWVQLLAIGLMCAALVIFFIGAATPPIVTVEWSTASELNTAGFNVLRGDNPTGPFTRLNSEVIPASPDPLVGGSYIYTDTRVTPGQTYYYQLEEVEFGGSVSTQGIVTVTAPRSVGPVFIVTLIGLGAIVIAVALWTRRTQRTSSEV
jgi:hypothetical protein